MVASRVRTLCWYPQSFRKLQASSKLGAWHTVSLCIQICKRHVPIKTWVIGQTRLTYFRLALLTASELNSCFLFGFKVLVLLSEKRNFADHYLPTTAHKGKISQWKKRNFNNFNNFLIIIFRHNIRYIFNIFVYRILT